AGAVPADVHVLDERPDRHLDDGFSPAAGRRLGVVCLSRLRVFDLLRGGLLVDANADTHRGGWGGRGERDGLLGSRLQFELAECESAQAGGQYHGEQHVSQFGRRHCASDSFREVERPITGGAAAGEGEDDPLAPSRPGGLYPFTNVSVKWLFGRPLVSGRVVFSRAGTTSPGNQPGRCLAARENPASCPTVPRLFQSISGSTF